MVEEIEANYSFYQKLSAGYDVNILVIGDSIGASSGASSSDYYWYNQLAYWLEENYMDGTDFDGDIYVNNISMGGNASYAGYVRTMNLDDDIDYDLAIICYGQNDSETDFSLYYESIIRAINSKYPGCNIISILESAQISYMESEDEYTDKMVAIQDICEHYNIPVVDTIAAFYKSGYDYSDLTDDDVHPNDTGYEIYLEAIEAVIEEQVEADTGKPEEVSAYSDGVEVFDNFIYYGVDDEETETDDNTDEDVEEAITFTRTDDYTFTLTVSQSGILGIDYTYESGENTAEIYIDGELYTSPTVTFDYDFSQRHILIVSSDITVESEITIVFGSSEQADGFYGMCFSWE